MLKEASEIKDKVNGLFSQEFNSLHTRMDEDFDVWEMSDTAPNITSYEAEVLAKTKAHSSEINIIANELRTNCDNVHSVLASADMQIAVSMAETGLDMRTEIGKLERLFYFALEQGDLRLGRLLLPPLRDTVIWDSLVRGWAATRILVYKRGKNVVFDFMPYDPRWLVYETGEDGLLDVGYKTFRTQADLKSAYNYDALAKNNEVIDWWEFVGTGKISNAVVCNNTFLREPKILNIPSMPIVIRPVSTRPPIAEGTGTKLKGYGESIFAPVRNINAVRNRFFSVAVNHASLMANQPLINYRGTQGKEIPRDAIFNVPGGVVELAMTENKLEASPMKEISPTVVQMLGWLNDQIERAILPKFSITNPPPSGTLYNLAQESGNKIFNPQLRNLSGFYADVCRLIEEQLIAGGIKVKVQDIDKGKYYETKVTPVDLKRSHIIKVDFTAQTPWSQLDTAQVADMLLRAGVPQGWIWEHIYKFQDPKGMGDQVAIEMAEHSPKLAMLRAIQAFIGAGRVDEAQQLMRDLYNQEMSEQTGGQTGEQVTTKPQETPPPPPPPPMEEGAIGGEYA